MLLFVLLCLFSAFVFVDVEEDEVPDVVSVLVVPACKLRPFGIKSGKLFSNCSFS